MIQDVRSSSAVSAPPAACPTVWGLSSRELHDAFWRGRGIQCVRRDEPTKLESAAELYLLIEPDQLVVFDVRDLSERLTWHDAAVTRVRLVDQDEQSYSERVVVDADGHVERIERRYVPRTFASCRIVLTPSRRITSLWVNAAERRAGWDRVRRSVPWSRVDHLKCPGRSFQEGQAGDERALLAELVERWPNPRQSIDGLAERDSGVWHMAFERPDPEAMYIGPCWIGLGRSSSRCLVGPAWKGDVDGREADTPRAIVRPITEVELAETPSAGVERRTAYAVIKRLIDIVGAATALVLAAPLMLIITVFIFLEDGRPLFFGHRRQGRNGRTFKCWKFRTMHRNAEEIARDLTEYNVCDGPQVFIQDDPRVTRIGRMLRQLHLDELPQFWNVLVGQMSIVGPRPSPDDENQFCPAWREMRLSVRPGITGLWQLKRTREPGEDFQEWIKYDIEYVRRAGLWLDLRIIVRTAWSLIAGRFERASE